MIEAHKLGRMYEDGHERPYNYDLAVEYYQKAVQQGHVDAMYRLACLLRDGDEQHEPNFEEALYWFTEAANTAHHAEAQHALGKYHADVRKDYAEAMCWYLKAAEHGSVDAMRNLGNIYYTGDCVATHYYYHHTDDCSGTNYAEAIRWYLKSAEQDVGSKYSLDIRLMYYRLGVMYEDGKGTEQDYQQAIEWYKKAAKHEVAGSIDDDGVIFEIILRIDAYDAYSFLDAKIAAMQANAWGQYNLGYYYSMQGDYQQAIEWYTKAAEQGHSNAQKALDRLKFNIAREQQKAKKTFSWQLKLENIDLEQCQQDAESFAELWKDVEIAAAQGDIDAQQYLGDAYINGKRAPIDYRYTIHYLNAMKWYQKAAEQGHAEAQYHLGNMYYWGEGVVINYAEAMKWYKKAAEQGYADAQYHLGDMYYQGEGAKKDHAEAIKWYTKAVEQGHAEAQYYLGLIYRTSDDVERDLVKAAELFLASAEQGHTRAQFDLGCMYENGEGVEKDQEEAIQWYRKAGGSYMHDEAQQALERLGAGE